MRLLSFRTDERSSFGALIEGRIVDLGKYMPEYESLRELLEAGALVRALDTAAEESAEFRLTDVELLAPLTDPGLVLCTIDDPEADPVLIDPKFLRGSEASLPVPAGAANPLAVGITIIAGKRGTEDDPHAAVNDIVGIALMAYLSPGVLSMGPWLVTREEIESLDATPLRVTAGDQTIELTISDCEAIFMRRAAMHELRAGDVIAVLHYLPELTIEAGMEVEVSSTDIGSLKHNISSTEPID